MEQTHLKQRWAGGSEPGPRPTAPQGLWQEEGGGTGQFHGFVPLLSASVGPVQVLTFPRHKQSSHRSYGKYSYPRGAGGGDAKGTIFERLIILMKNLQEIRRSQNNSSRPTLLPHRTPW